MSAGLDVAHLRSLRAPRHDVGMMLRRIEDHLAAHDGYLPLSGGKDSVVVLHLVRQVDPNVPVVFFDSGLEFPETYRYLAELTDAWQLRADWIQPRQSLLEALVASGDWDHHSERRQKVDLHQLLITEPAAHAHDRYGRGELWGVRADESRGRAAAYANAIRRELRSCWQCCSTVAQQRQRHGGVIRRRDATVAYGPIWDWSSRDVWAYIARHHLPINPVYAKLAALGAPEHARRVSHILDGGQLERGRLVWLRRGWPALFEELTTALPRLREVC